MDLTISRRRLETGASPLDSKISLPDMPRVYLVLVFEPIGHKVSHLSMIHAVRLNVSIMSLKLQKRPYKDVYQVCVS
jgi:hypothetical protein